MSFAARVARLQEDVFGTFGEDATWTGVATPVRVRRREEDEGVRFDRGELLVEGHHVRVRKVEVSSPAIGDEVQVLDDDGNPVVGAAYIVNGDPRLDRKGVWHCPVKPAL